MLQGFAGARTGLLRDTPYTVLPSSHDQSRNPRAPHKARQMARAATQGSGGTASAQRRSHCRCPPPTEGHRKGTNRGPYLTTDQAKQAVQGQGITQQGMPEPKAVKQTESSMSGFAKHTDPDAAVQPLITLQVTVQTGGKPVASRNLAGPETRPVPGVKPTGRDGPPAHHANRAA